MKNLKYAYFDLIIQLTEFLKQIGCVFEIKYCNSNQDLWKVEHIYSIKNNLHSIIRIQIQSRVCKYIYRKGVGAKV